MGRCSHWISGKTKLGLKLRQGMLCIKSAACRRPHAAAVEHEHGACRTKQPPTATDYRLEDKCVPVTFWKRTSYHVFCMDKAEDFCTDGIREICPFAGSQDGLPTHIW